MGKPKLENLKDFILKNISAKFWIIRNQLQRTERRVNTTDFSQKRTLFDWDPGGRNDAGSCGQRWLCMPR